MVVPEAAKVRPKSISVSYLADGGTDLSSKRDFELWCRGESDTGNGIKTQGRRNIDREFIGDTGLHYLGTHRAESRVEAVGTVEF